MINSFVSFNGHSCLFPEDGKTVYQVEKTYVEFNIPAITVKTVVMYGAPFYQYP